MLKIIALFIPAFISVCIYCRRQSVALAPKLALFLRYGIYALLVNWCDMSIVVYIFGIRNCVSESLESAPFFTKYTLMALFLAWIVPYMEEIVRKSVDISFRAEAKTGCGTDGKDGSKISRHMERLITFLWFLTLFGIIMIGSRVIFSGFHLVDDHWVLKTNTYRRDGMRMFEIMRLYVYQDLAIRFRPCYQIMLVLKTYILGSNLNIWMAVSMLEGIVTAFMLTFICMNQGVGFIPSLMIATVGILGQQFMPWCRSLNAENTPAMFLSVALFIIGHVYLRNDNLDRKWWVRTAIMASTVFAAGYKESFCLAIPAVGLYIMYWHFRKYPEDAMKRAFLRNIDYLACFTTVFVYEMYFIFTKIGLMPVGYAGVDQVMGLGDYGRSIVGSFTTNMPVMGGLTVVWFLLLLSFVIIGIIKRQLPRVNFWFVIFAIYSMTTQLILYAKSGMWGRYILPFNVFWCICVLTQMVLLLKKEKLSYMTLIIGCILAIRFEFEQSWAEAMSWKTFGDDTHAFLNNLDEHLETGRFNSVLLHINDGEYDYATWIWLEHYYPALISQVDDISNADVETGYDVILTSLSFYDGGSILNRFGKTSEEYEICTIDEEFVLAYIK